MHLVPLVLGLFIVFILSALSYLVLLTINNIIWGYKGISTDKESQLYMKRKRSLKLISIPLSIFIVVIIGFARTDDSKKNSSSGLKEQIQMLAHKSGLSATNFQKALNSLDKIGYLDTISKRNNAIRAVEQAQLLFYKANEDSDALTDFINQHKIKLRKEGLNVFFKMEGLRDETYFSHRKALREYLETYKQLLAYSRDNYEAIIGGQQPQSNTYNQIYLEYRTALDIHNEAYLKHMKFVEQYSRDHPDLFEFISKARQEIKEK